MDLIEQAICANIFVLAFPSIFPQVVEFSIGHELEITNAVKLSELRGRAGRRTAHVAYMSLECFMLDPFFI